MGTSIASVPQQGGTEEGPAACPAPVSLCPLRGWQADPRCSVCQGCGTMVKLDIHTLAHHLKQERLYVSSEKALIQRLNADVLKTAERLYRTAWISKQQRINLDRLIITRYCTPLCQPSQPAGLLCCQSNGSKPQLGNLTPRGTCWLLKQLFF